LDDETQYGYDDNDNLTIITDANGHTTTFEYDGFDRLIEERDPLGHGPTYTYDDAGNVKTRTDALSQMTVYTYNAVNWLTNIDYPDDSDVTFEYDAVGDVTRTTDKNVDIHYTYDALNRLESASYLPFDKTISYTYDLVGNRATMIDYDGGTTTYEYDDVNRLSTLTNPLNQVTTWEYDPAGQLTRKDYHNGTYATYTYTDTNWLISLVNEKSTGEVLSSYAYEYDNVGNRTRMTEAGGGETSYGYDGLYQLTAVTYPDASTTEYQYDPAGNRLVMTDTTGTTLYSYDNANRLLTAGTVAYTWDDNGNQASKVEGGNTTAYAYDYENRLTGITFPDGSTNRFTYYPDGQRLSVTNKAGKTTYYFYDGFNALVETDSGGTTVARYTSGLGIDDWISMDRGTASYYYHYDGLGSVTVLSDASKTVVASYVYDPWGNILEETGSVENPFRYTGREWDAESRSYYYRARYYDPEVGRFTTKDPIGFAGGVNLYGYVRGNPIRYLDPWGLCEKGDPAGPKRDPRDLNGDGKVDGWDKWMWFWGRRLWDLLTPPTTPYPPGYGDEGPGSNDPIWGPSLPEEWIRYYRDLGI
jgi:RHS repeat-associated protein